MRARIPIKVANNLFELLVTEAYEVILNRLTVGLDELKFPMLGTERDEMEPHAGARVYHIALRDGLNWVRKVKPPMLCFGIGGDLSRSSLYGRIARRLEKIGYQCASIDQQHFYCYREEKN